MSLGVVLGSAFSAFEDCTPIEIQTRVGPIVLHQRGDAWIWFRHGSPHTWLPNQIPYRAFAWALREVGVTSLLVTSSVGVLAPSVPLFKPLLVQDLVWLDNRLPDGTCATVWNRPMEGQGHLVVEHLFSPVLGEQIRVLADACGAPIADEVVFWYAPGPRTKTRAENRVLAAMGLEVNSMTLAPEVVLANELGISVAGLVVGHKLSREDSEPLEEEEVRQSLRDARVAVERIVLAFLERGQPVPNDNLVVRL